MASKSINGFRGTELLNSPRYNKGTAFTEKEREEYGLEGLLPPVVESLQQQVDRVYGEYSAIGDNPLAKNIFLASLRTENIVLYFGLVSQHLFEMLPIVYTPTQGDAIANYSNIFRRPEGCFLDIEHKDPELIRKILSQFGQGDDIEYIIITDSEGILGIGDQGVGGVLISVAKGNLMTLCAGLNPHKLLPIVLDVGTNNKKHRSNPLYMGLRRDRVRGQEYDDYVDTVLSCIKEVFPHAFVHFEDFGLVNAKRILDKYRKRIACFNDDIQGTGAVALAAVVSTLHIRKEDLHDQRFIIFGAGTAGIGIADQMMNAMMIDGLSQQEAYDRIFLIDRYGLLLEKHRDVATEGQKRYLKPDSEFADLDVTGEGIGLEAAISRIKPNILIGCSGQPGKFTEGAIREMAKHTDRPVIFPISNPTSLVEARPAQINEWTEGRALIATGSPFPAIERDGKLCPVAQCNNALLYPALGVACILSRCQVLTDEMIKAAADALAHTSPALKDPSQSLLPDITNIRDISRHIILAVLRKAEEQGANTVAVPKSYEEVAALEWNPRYE
ncbi:NAD-dependent malic enzyme [Schizosaccharomyces japonicus yFS275]|uniref:Malic enzyme n=1 Tax=Schizosaccharomyces japonicus (strain yFS275 / FY16936) TaxID=402676 RepID=B6K1R4_SCHJY|nr:NAD-dependent malic enzyme [Schizosaccharomyces japonicus yFS275]EEB07095.1 NAD-dependent malic enzyme [Schizosaccharomyces japonicus yFS275]